jgi:hypothetical protein
MSAFVPLPPFESWPLHVVEPRFGFVWYCGDGMLVAHWMCTQLTEDAVHAYQDVVDRVLGAYADELRSAGGLYTIQDLRQTTSYEGSARRVWQARMSRRKSNYMRGATAVTVEASPLLKMAIAGLNMMAALSFGSSIELASDIHAVLRKHGVRAPVKAFRAV